MHKFEKPAKRERRNPIINIEIVNVWRNTVGNMSICGERLNPMGKILDAFFEKLYRDNFIDLFKYAYRLTCEKNLAEEIVQDAFAEAYRKIELLSEHVSPVGWLYVTTRNIARAYIREYQNLRELIPLENNKTAADDKGYEELLLINCLDKDETQIITKYYIDKKSLMEISEEYDITLSACKMRLKRARDKLKGNYEKEK